MSAAEIKTGAGEAVVDTDRTKDGSPGELETLLRAPASPRSHVDPASRPEVTVGRIVSGDASGRVEVEFPGSGCAVPARLALALSPAQLASAEASRQEVVLSFENGDPRLPIILGLLHEPSGEPVVTVEASMAAPSASTVLEADVDGKRVRIVAQDEVVLQCGAASVTLRRNGRVVIRGTYVETCSEGTNRIKGGQVRIN